MLRKYALISLFCLLIFSPHKTFAQQTIFNVPSADVTEKNQIFTQFEGQFSDDFGLFTNYAAYGIGYMTELDLTLTGYGSKKFRNEVLLAGFKSSFPIYKYDTKLTVGHLIPISLRGNGVGGYSYSHLSSVIPKLKTRVTSGVLVATSTIFGKDTVCYIAGLEHPVNDKLAIILDYTSGSHSNGLLIAGVSYKFTPKTTLYAGYQIPNSSKYGDHGFVVELAKVFR